SPCLSWRDGVVCCCVTVLLPSISSSIYSRKRGRSVLFDLILFPSIYCKLVSLVPWSAYVGASQAPDAETLGNTRRQLIDASADLNGGELQSRSLSEHLFCIERITRE